MASLTCTVRVQLSHGGASGIVIGVFAWNSCTVWRKPSANLATEKLPCSIIVPPQPSVSDDLMVRSMVPGYIVSVVLTDITLCIRVPRARPLAATRMLTVLSQTLFRHVHLCNVGYVALGQKRKSEVSTESSVPCASTSERK